VFSLDTNDRFFHVFIVGFGAHFAGQQVAEDYSFCSARFVRLNDYWLLRTYGRLEVNHHLAFTFRIENAANQHYYTTIGYPALGTTVFGGAEVRF
jgi:outer membrane cobalamin receptor